MMGYHIAASAPAFHPGNYWRLPPYNQPLVDPNATTQPQDEPVEQPRRYNPQGPDTDVELLRITPKQNGRPLKYVDTDSVYLRNNRNVASGRVPTQLVHTDVVARARPKARYVSAFRTNTQLIEDTRRRIVSDLNTRRTLLILKPVAKAVAGAGGTARATPVSHAVVRKGDAVDIHFDPQAVAVVGPGGSATAYSDLVITYTA